MSFFLFMASEMLDTLCLSNPHDKFSHYKEYNILPNILWVHYIFYHITLLNRRQMNVLQSWICIGYVCLLFFNHRNEWVCLFSTNVDENDLLNRCPCIMNQSCINPPLQRQQNNVGTCDWNSCCLIFLSFHVVFLLIKWATKWRASGY